MYYTRLVSFGVQTKLSSWTQSILVHLPCEDKWVFHQGHNPEAVPFNRKSRPPATSKVAVTLAIPSPHPGSKTLSLAGHEPSHQSQNATLQLQSTSGPLAYSNPSRLPQSTSFQTPYMKQLGGQNPRNTSIDLDQACGPGEGSVGEKPRGTEDKEQIISGSQQNIENKLDIHLKKVQPAILYR